MRSESVAGAFFSEYDCADAHVTATDMGMLPHHHASPPKVCAGRTNCSSYA